MPDNGEIQRNDLQNTIDSVSDRLTSFLGNNEYLRERERRNIEEKFEREQKKYEKEIRDLKQRMCIVEASLKDMKDLQHNFRKTEMQLVQTQKELKESHIKKKEAEDLVTSLKAKYEPWLNDKENVTTAVEKLSKKLDLADKK